MRACGCLARLGARRPIESVDFSCRAQGARAIMRRMRTPLATLLLAAALSCGGQAVTPEDAGQGTADSPTEDRFASDGSNGTDGGLPAPDSSQCNLPDSLTCVFCSDYNWHCGALIWQPCPVDLDASSSCLGILSDASANQTMNTCFACASDGGGDQWQCQPNGHWSPISYPCIP